MNYSKTENKCYLVNYSFQKPEASNAWLDFFIVFQPQAYSDTLHFMAVTRMKITSVFTFLWTVCCNLSDAIYWSRKTSSNSLLCIQTIAPVGNFLMLLRLVEKIIYRHTMHRCFGYYIPMPTYLRTQLIFML